MTSKNSARVAAHVMAIALGLVGSASAGYVTMSQQVDGLTVLDGGTISITAGESINFSLFSSFFQQDYYSSYVPSYYFGGYGGYINITGYGVSGSGGWQGSMTFYDARDESDPYSQLFSVSDTAGHSSGAANGVFEYLDAGLYTVSMQVTDLYIQRFSSQGCGGSAWGQWGGFSGAYAWCTNPYFYDSSYSAAASTRQTFHVNVLASVSAATAIPEPGSIALVGVALAAVGAVSRKRRRRSA